MAAPAYHVRSDLASVGIGPEILAKLDAGKLALVEDAIAKRNAFADGKLAASGRYTMPITAWPPDVTQHAAMLTAWDVMSVIVGTRPNGEGGERWEKRRDEALAWFNDVATGRAVPQGIVDSSVEEEIETGFVCVADELRGELR